MTEDSVKIDENREMRLARLEECLLDPKSDLNIDGLLVKNLEFNQLNYFV